LPISAVDAIGPSFQHTKQQLTQPFRIAQWAKLALVGFLAGELTSGGCSTSGFQMPTPTPTHSGGSGHFLATAGALPNPMLYASLIATLIVCGFIFFVVFMYLSSVMRFVLFDSIVQKTCEIRRGWERHHQHGLRYFVWQILVLLVTGVGITILIGIPAAFGFAVGWLRDPKAHIVPLILSGMLLFFVVLIFFLALFVVHVFTKDFVVPQMAIDDVSAMEGWRRLLPMLRMEKGAYTGYAGLKVAMTLGAAAIVGIIAGILILIMLIPLGGFGALVVLGGKTAGLTWNAYTITLAVVIGTVVVGFILYVMSLVSVPAIVFFPAYSIYFFASRYPRLDALIHPAPPLPPPYVPPVLEPLPPPDPIG
jgi:hypothetical protein